MATPLYGNRLGMAYFLQAWFDGRILIHGQSCNRQQALKSERTYHRHRYSYQPLSPLARDDTRSELKCTSYQSWQPRANPLGNWLLWWSNDCRGITRYTMVGYICVQQKHMQFCSLGPTVINCFTVEQIEVPFSIVGIFTCQTKASPTTRWGKI